LGHDLSTHPPLADRDEHTASPDERSDATIVAFNQPPSAQGASAVVPDTYSVEAMSYFADPARYDVQPYRRCGRSGLKLPAISLGFWHNFGDDKPLETQRAVMRRAFDLGVSHFDLANNYGPPYGAAERNVGRILREDFAAYRDELVISSKAGWDMWPGPYGDFGSRKYLTASLDQSLSRLGLDYVDIFYHHRPDPETPLEETMGALDAAVRAGKALYVGVSSYSPEHTAQAAAILRDLGTPLVIHQPSYSMFNRWIEDGLLPVLEQEGIGCIAFTALAQGLLTNRYLTGVPADSRAAQGKSLSQDSISEEILEKVRALNEIAAGRDQSLAQLALAWVLRDERMTSTLIGASSVQQLEDNVAAVGRLDFTDDELAEIDKHAVDSGVDLWATARSATG
jgi:L-glyceraldehyde 3-phosphate reductase